MRTSIDNNRIRATVRTIFNKGISRFLSDKQFIVCDYYLTYGKFPNLRKPKTISEKTQWIKIYGGLEKYSHYVDKLRVRDFIRKTIGAQYLIPLIGCWHRFEDIPFKKLPRRFVLKATHGSGYVFVCKDKSSLNIKDLKKIVTKWMREDFYKITREIQYKKCKPMILCEKYLEDRSEGLTDYKIYCSNGTPYMVEVIWGRFTEHKYDTFLDVNWKKLPIWYPEHPPSKETIQRPYNFADMLDIAKKLSQQFPFVRVDLYSVKNKIYFGELTLTPDNGLGIFKPSKAYYVLGKLIDISKYNIL